MTDCVVIVRDGVVVDAVMMSVAEAAAAFPDAQAFDRSAYDPAPGIGWQWDGKRFAAPAPVPDLSAAKAVRQSEVDAIVVITAAGRSFDGDERSQERMSRALAALDDGESVTWVLHDNAVASIGKAELREALRLAGAAQTAIWVRPYQ